MSEIQSDEALYALLSRAGESRRLAAGDIVFEKGSRGESIYILSSGTVTLTDGERT
jgi:CRP-like cAMP-binding protein